MAAELRLHNSDRVARVDPEDLAELSRWRWILLGSYVVRQQRTDAGQRVLIYLHRYLVQARPWEVVDHDDRDTLNNQRANLVRCSQSENLAKIPARAPHGFRGVYPERGGSWRAQIKVHGKNKRLGTFRTPEAAARAYDVAAVAAWGRFARPNFPGETPEQLGLFDPFDVPAPAARVDFLEIAQERRWRAAQAPEPGQFEGQSDNCGIPF